VIASRPKPNDRQVGRDCGLRARAGRSGCGAGRPYRRVVNDDLVKLAEEGRRRVGGSS